MPCKQDMLLFLEVEEISQWEKDRPNGTACGNYGCDFNSAHGDEDGMCELRKGLTLTLRSRAGTIKHGPKLSVATPEDVPDTVWNLVPGDGVPEMQCSGFHARFDQ